MPYSLLVIAAGVLIAGILGFLVLPLFLPRFLLVFMAAVALAGIGLILLPVEVILRRRLAPNWRTFGIALPAFVASLLAIEHVRIGRFARSAEENGFLRVPFDAKTQAILIDWDETATQRDITGAFYAGTARSLAMDQRLMVYRNFDGRSVVLRTTSVSPNECDQLAEEKKRLWGLPDRPGGWSGGMCVAAYAERPDVPVVKIEIHRKNGIFGNNHLELLRISAPGQPPLVAYGGAYWGRLDCVKSGSRKRCGGATTMIKAVLRLDPWSER